MLVTFVNTTSPTLAAAPIELAVIPKAPTVISFNGLPANGIAPPINAPSAPNLILLDNLAIAKSLPVLPS